MTFSLRDFCEPGDEYVDFSAGTRESIPEVPSKYAPRQWDGSMGAVIESEKNPWVQDAEGNVFDFGGDGMRELYGSGVLVGGAYIQRDDLADWQDSFTDLHAALVAARMVEHITGRPHFVWYIGA